MKIETYRINLTPEEKETALQFHDEGCKKARAIRDQFGQDTREMMLFMYALSILRAEYPGLFMETAPQRIGEWIAAGQPESLDNIANVIIERSRKEADEARRNDRANWN